MALSGSERVKRYRQRKRGIRVSCPKCEARKSSGDAQCGATVWLMGDWRIVKTSTVQDSREGFERSYMLEVKENGRWRPAPRLRDREELYALVETLVEG